MLWSHAPQHGDTAKSQPRIADDRHIQTLLPDGGHVWSTMLLGCTPVFPKPSQQDDHSVGPQAFLVEQSPESMLGTHFHLEDQFQVIVSGGGWLGQHAVDAVSVHYASRHNGYGPIKAGKGGLTYFTLRARGDRGAWYLPQDSEVMDRKARRRQAVGTTAPAGADCPSLPGTRIDPIIEQATDGLGAWDLRIGAGQTCESYSGAVDAVADRFLLITSGTILIDGEPIAAPSVVFLGRVEQPALCSQEGARLLILQFPGGRQI